MKKIVIVGPSGAGKSELARKLHNITNLPLYHLDNIFWKDDKTHLEKSEFDNIVSSLVKKDCWIIDGDYSRTYEIRIANCDAIFFLDYPLEVCLKGVESRIGTKRDDIPWVEHEFDPEFKEWIINWRINKLPILLSLLEKYKNKQIIIFKNRNEADNYLEKLRQSI